jgi:hypothetical protein
VRELISFHPAPGFSDERITIVIAEGVSGEIRSESTDGGEPLRVTRMSVREAYENVLLRRITDSKTIVAICLLMLAAGEDSNDHRRS